MFVSDCTATSTISTSASVEWCPDQERRFKFLNLILHILQQFNLQGYIFSSGVIFFPTPLYRESKKKMLLRDAFFHHIFSPALIFPYSPPRRGGGVVKMEKKSLCIPDNKKSTKQTLKSPRGHNSFSLYTLHIISCSQICP